MPASACAFCRILSGDEDAAIVYQNDRVLAFLDNRPLFPGHVLLVPNKHFETMADLPPDWIAPLFASAQLLVRAVEAGMRAEGSFVAVNNRISQSVPHLHVHIVPRRKGDGLRGFFWPRNKYKDDEEMRRAQEAIRAHLQKTGQNS
jgi:histidine triad (HIT) family protein